METPQLTAVFVSSVEHSTSRGYEDFVLFLRKQLDSYGISSFASSEADESSPENDWIAHIHNAQLRVVVLSHDYVASQRCLRELDEIMTLVDEQFGSMNPKVLPVYYDDLSLEDAVCSSMIKLFTVTDPMRLAESNNFEGQFAKNVALRINQLLLEVPCQHQKSSTPWEGRDHPSYHVFINHRGPDTKKQFVDFLHESLTQKGITSFVDYQSLRPGKSSWASILNAISHSSIHLVVLSDTYADSEWCLDELLEIIRINSHHSSRTKVIPIYYYENHNLEHTISKCVVTKDRIKCEDTKADEWVTALNKLSRIEGIDIHNFRSGTDRTGFLLQIVASVENELNHLIIDLQTTATDNLNAALEMLNMSDRKEVMCLGIAGRANSETSTLAKNLYNKLQKDFKASSILLDVGEKLVRSQAKVESDHSDKWPEQNEAHMSNFLAVILKDLLKLQLRDMSVQEVVNLLKHRLKAIECLLIIDDVRPGPWLHRKESTYLKLIKKLKDCLGPGSQLIITSQFEAVLSQHLGVDKILKLPLYWPQGSTYCHMMQGPIDVLITYHSHDVDFCFINHLCELFYMMGFTCKIEDCTTYVEIPCSEMDIKLFVLVLSNAFLGSPICLKRLANVLDMGSRVSPIFYGFANADALNVPASLCSSSLFTTDEECFRQREDLLERISNMDTKFVIAYEGITTSTDDKKNYRSTYLPTKVEKMLTEEFKYKPKGKVVDFPVGLKDKHERVDDILRTSHHLPGVKMLGIVGAGGVGKTTFVKSLYNKLHGMFEGGAILVDICKDERTLGDLQTEIIKQVTGFHRHISTVLEGKEYLQSCLAGMTTLLILDGINDQAQLDALLWSYAPILGQRSLVVVTSQCSLGIINEAAFRQAIYHMEPLSTDDSTMLLSWHAFDQPYPPTELEKDVSRAIERCQYLPNSLKILGGIFYNKIDPEYWEDALNDVAFLENKLPNQECSCQQAKIRARCSVKMLKRQST